MKNKDLNEILLKSKNFNWEDGVDEESKVFYAINKDIQAKNLPDDIKNPYINTLIKRIGLIRYFASKGKELFNDFYKGTMQYGGIVQDISTGLLQQKMYSFEYLNPFEVFKNEIKSEYHIINRRARFETTVSETKLLQSFNTKDGVSQLVNNIIDSLIESDKLYINIYFKHLLYSTFTSQELKLKDTQKVKVPDLSNSKTKGDYESFLVTVMNVISALQFSSSDFNRESRVTYSDKSNLTLLMRYDLINKNKVFNLSGTFNMLQDSLNIKIIPVDNFDGMDGSVEAVLCDTRTFSVIDNITVFNNINNPRNLSTNYFLHHHQAYINSGFSNLVYFVNEKPTENKTKIELPNIENSEGTQDKGSIKTSSNLIKDLKKESELG